MRISSPPPRFDFRQTFSTVLSVTVPVCILFNMAFVGSALAEVPVLHPLDDKTEHSPKPTKQSWVDALKLPKQVTSAQVSDKAKKQDVPAAMPMLELQPELDLGEADPASKPAPAARSADEPLKAKAVVVDVNSKTLTYDKDRDVYIATGSVHVVISEQNSELFADQVIYDQNQNLLIAEGHVVILKNGERTPGSYAKIDLTRESALINDITTRVGKVRITAQQSMIASDSMVFENGQIIIDAKALAGAMNKSSSGKGKAKAKSEPLQGSVDAYSEDDLGSLAKQASGNSLSQKKNVDLGEVALKQSSTGKSNFHIKAQDIDIYRWADGYSKIDIKNPSLYYKNWKVAGLRSSQFSQSEVTNETEYLGPDLGFDPDYGGFHYGPGWDFRLGQGSVRISPLLSYGGGARRGRGGSQFEDTGVGPGIGGILHYRGDDSLLDLAYNSRVGQPIGYVEKKLFDGKTKIRASMNEDYNNGFMGYERPKYGAMLSDTRKIWGNETIRLDAFSSIGFFKDEFYPTNQADYFVQADPTSTPGSAARAQLQFQFANTKPLLQVGEHLDVGFRLQGSMAGYSTGDMVGVIRGGPNVNLRFGDRWRSSMQYYFAQVAGETPFIFDSYYQGRQQIGWTNSLKINNYVTVGNKSQLSLLRDNARKDLFTGNQLFMLVGPKNVKLNLAYDVIRQRSYFGLQFLPGQDSKPIDYDTLRIFSPDQYNAPVGAKNYN